jgi:hypothetical protein
VHLSSFMLCLVGGGCTTFHQSLFGKILAGNAHARDSIGFGVGLLITVKVFEHPARDIN